MKKSILANRSIVLAGSAVVIIALVLIGIFSDRLGAKTYTGSSPSPSATPFQKCTLSVAERASIEKQIRLLQTQINDLTSQEEELSRESVDIKNRLTVVENEATKQKDAKKLTILKNEQKDLNTQLSSLENKMNGISIKIHDANYQIVTLQNKLKDCTTVLFSPSPSTTPNPTPSTTPPPPPPPPHPTATITPIHTPPLKK
ncbi:MAG: hypothetical protein K8Q97_04515 [Candidatus Andersenbacteria bacterium]|nr:hypothetical protein [Candidatus Andersenbacteria bacterium]